MIALYNFIPRFCPHCGERLSKDYSLDNYLQGLAHTCQCGLGFAQADTDEMLECAGRSESDLPAHYPEG